MDDQRPSSLGQGGREARALGLLTEAPGGDLAVSGEVPQSTGAVALVSLAQSGADVTHETLCPWHASPSPG